MRAITSFLETIVRKVFNAAGLDIAWGDGEPSPLLPLPSPQIVHQTAAYYTNTFALHPGVGLTRPEIEAQLAQFDWFFPFVFDDIAAPTAHPMAPAALSNAFANRFLHIFSGIHTLTGGSLVGKRVLDVGCNSGFFAILARRAEAASVLGIDASPKNIEQAHLVLRLTGLDRITYQVMNVYDITRDRLGTFDITLFFGILYHLDNPVGALARLFDVTNEMLVVDTQLVPMRMPMFRVEPDTISYHRESHMNALAFIPSESAVVRLLKSVGFARVFRVPVRPSSPAVYRMGRWGTFVALKDSVAVTD